MNKKTQVLLYVMLLIASGCSLAQSLPKNILKQIPGNYTVLAYESGLLNADKLVDFIVVLHKPKEESIGNIASPVRPLLIFIHNPDNTFKLAKRNDHVVFKFDEGGQCDPFTDSDEGLVIYKRYFTVQHSVACGQHWTDYITFRFVPALQDWVFHKRISESCVLNTSTDPNADALIPGGREVISAKGKAPILFEKYRSN